MHLNDNPLQVCLCALESWYPTHTVDINKGIIASKEIPLTGWKASEVVQILTITAPQLLHAKAELIIEYGVSAIYVPDISTTEPLCFVHCQGKIPPHNADSKNWLKQELPYPCDQSMILPLARYQQH